MKQYHQGICFTKCDTFYLDVLLNKNVTNTYYEIPMRKLLSTLTYHTVVLIN